MKNIILLAFLFLLPMTLVYAQEAAPAAPPADPEAKKPVLMAKDGMVPDEQTAIRIAEAVWIPIYGEDTVLREQPFMATLNDKTWEVTSISPGAVKEGTIKAQISKMDGRIISVSRSD